MVDFILKYFPVFYSRSGNSWWRHQMETFSALLAICAGNSPVSGEFLAQRPVMRGFGVFFDLPLNKRLSKQSWGWWLETLSCSLWRQSNVFCLGEKEIAYSDLSLRKGLVEILFNCGWTPKYLPLTLPWRHMRVMASKTTGNATVCSTVCLS